MSETPSQGSSRRACSRFTRSDEEHEWRTSLAVDEVDFRRRMQQIGVTVQPQIGDHVIQWRLMNFAFGLKGANENAGNNSNTTPGSATNMNTASGTAAPVHPITPAQSPARGGPSSLTIPDPAAMPPVHSFSPGSHQLASVLLNLDPATAKASATGLLSPMSQLTTIARTVSQAGREKAKADAAAAAAIISTSAVKRPATTAGLAHSTSKKQKATSGTGAATATNRHSLSPPKPVRLPAAAHVI